MNTAVSYLPGANAPEAEIRRVFDRQWTTALRLRTSSVDERRAKIKKLRDTVLARSEEFYEAGYKDFRKPPIEVDMTEIIPIAVEANDALRSLRKWMKPKGVWPTPLMGGTKSWVQFEPKGRSLIISPWNYPVNLTFGPLVSAIAAGNTAILKPSEMTPHLSGLMVRIVRELFSEDEVAIFEGDASVSQVLLSLPFDHIFFTGSPAIGKVVMGAAAKHLASVTLELGGKSPTIVDQSADLKLAAQNILWGKYTNNGQTCIAPDHIFVHESVKDAFVEQCKAVLAKAYGSTPDEQFNSPYLARVVNQRHTQRIAGLLSDATQRGARVLAGGQVRESECFVQPTLIDNIPADAKIQSEEIFGPLLPILPFRNLDEVVRQINEQPKPLALYIWSKTEANIQKVLKNTSAGGTCINHTVVHFLHAHLPFGGVNNSGIGNAHGFYGFRAFSHERAVVRTRFMAARMFFPPYTPLTLRLIGMIKKLAKILA